MNKTIAVYGTLRKGFANNTLLNQSEYLGTGITKEARFKMKTVGFPFTIPVSEDGSKVRVELYKVDACAGKSVDQLEGYPGWYTKEKIVVIMDDGTEAKADIYLMDENEAHGQDVEPEGGVLDWVEHEKSYW